ncbi:MAG: LPS assembly lipoprotein LptE [Gammaproteobacteria bacterium]|nr:LPS assembly lipoprotein LptE [Gammaproteobacteria bacterium]
MSILLSACGFHLRGTVVLPASMANTYVDGERYPDLTRALRDQLQGSNVRLVESASNATARIRLLSATRSRRILSVDANGQANAYELIYQVSFELLDAEGGILLPSQSLVRSRDLNVSGDNLLGKSSEEEQIYDSLLLSMASAILQRIQYSRQDSTQ